MTMKRLRDYFKDKLNIDILKTIKESPPSVLIYDEKFTVPAFGYSSKEEYY